MILFILSGCALLTEKDWTDWDDIHDSNSSETQIVAGLSIVPTGTIYNDDNLICVVNVVASDEDVTIEYAWTVEERILGNTSDVDLSSAGVMPDDAVKCIVTIADSEGNEFVDETSKIIGNRKPVLSEIQIHPSIDIRTNTELTCSALVKDDDGESVNPTYEWNIGSNTYEGNILQLDNTIVSPNDVVSCSVNVVDGYGGSDSTATAINVGNTELVLETISMDNPTPSFSSVLDCSITYSDVDNDVDSIEFIWKNETKDSTYFIDNQLANQSHLDLSLYDVDFEDEISCNVTISDGQSSDTNSDSSIIF